MKAFKPMMISVILLLFFSSHAKSQDTLKISRVRVSKTVLLSPKTNRIIEAWPHWVKVEEGYIIRKHGFYYFNGQYWHATEDENNNLLAITPVSDKELIAANLKK
ncbi:MAG: hypothetical protein ACTHM5_12580 [Ginsengibacter sp.]